MADGGGDKVGDTVGETDPGHVSPDYLERKSNRNSWWIVGIFTAVIVLVFLFVGISIAMG